VQFEDWMELVVHVFEASGVAILAVGSLVALVGAARAVSRGERRTAYEQARQHVGRAILLGLEVLIIADIVQTITIDPTLEIELHGRVPWRTKPTADDADGSESH
jgi:uncharacterized membrane protein